MISKPVRTVIAAIVTMLALGSIYAWSIYVPRLVAEFGFSTGQTQLIFGLFIAVFTVTMVFGPSLITRYGAKRLALWGSFIYAFGFSLIPLSGVSFMVLLVGISLFAGIATGFGYLISISIPVEWFPQKKGLITGLVSAGFGAGAILESQVVQVLLEREFALAQIFLIVGVGKGVLLFVASFFIDRPALTYATVGLVPLKELLSQSRFWRLFAGIFTGTFAGLLVIGNLKPIGAEFPIEETTLVLGITIFSIANFMGRLFWGWLNDYVSGRVLIPLSLLMMSVFTLLIGLMNLTPSLYLFIAFAVGFSFGANFVIYAKETAQIYGLNNLGKIYPFVFLGYGISGVAGPFTGGVLKDLTGSYQDPAYVAAALCLIVFFVLLMAKPQN